MLRELFIIGLIVLSCGSSEARRSKSKQSSESSKATTEEAAASKEADAAKTAPSQAAASPGPAPQNTATTQNPAGATQAAAAATDASQGSQPDGQRKLSQAEIDSTLGEASALFKAGQHEQAARKLLLVYDSSPQPLLLFNAGQAFRRAKIPKEAKDCYVRFLESAPQSPLVPEVRGYVRDMDTLLEMQQREQEISLRLKQEQAAATSAQQALQKERSTPVYKRGWFWVVMGSVGLVVITGVAVGGFIGQRTKADLAATIEK